MARQRATKKKPRTKKTSKKAKAARSLAVLDTAAELCEPQIDPYAGLNEAQKKVVAHDAGPLIVPATAGSGKTHAVTRRLARLALDGVNMKRVLATTFTKKAAGEMNERLDVLLGKGKHGARVGTLHSLCLEIIRDGSPWARWEVDANDRMRLHLKKLLGWSRDGSTLNWRGADLSDVAGFIGGCKNDLIGPQESRKVASDLRMDPRFVEAYFMYEERREREQLITFDDMLKLSVEYLRSDPDARTRWEGRYDHIIVDEFQDTNLAQYELLKILITGTTSFMVVGDDMQCQPGNTKVRVKTEGLKGAYHWKRLDAVSETDRMSVFQRHNGKVVGSRKVNKTSVRKYSGPLHVIEVDLPNNKIVRTETTPGHKFLVRWKERNPKYRAVYLMWRNDYGYRIGQCQLFGSLSSNKVFHLGHRARLEKADATWILHIVEGKASAEYMEQLLSAEYGIPMRTFEPLFQSRITTEQIKKIFRVSSGNEGGENVLKDFNLSFDHPFYPLPADSGTTQSGKHRGTIFKIYAANLMPEYMYVPVLLDDDTTRWLPIGSVSIKSYKGNVYSLDVADEHNYVANQIVTCNSIYRWRGARPEYFTKFESTHNGATRVDLTINYRSVPPVVVHGEKVAAHSQECLQKKVEAHRDDPGTPCIDCVRLPSTDAEAEWVRDRILELREDGLKWGDVKILYRVNAQSRPFEERFLDAKIPHVVVGGTDFFKRKEVKDLLNYMRAALDHENDDAVLACVNRPFRFIGVATVEQIKDAVPKGCALDEIRRGGPSGVRSRQSDSLREFAGIVDGLAEKLAEQEDPEKAEHHTKNSDVFAWLLKRTQYEQWLLRDEGSDTTENSRIGNIAELVRTSDRFPTMRHFVEFVDDMQRRKAKRKKDEKGDLVQLMTVYKAKGLEAPVVFVVGASEKIMPHGRSTDIEEERRVFYVAVTRARDRLYVTSPAAVQQSGHLGPSPFITEAGFDMREVDDDGRNNNDRTGDQVERRPDA